MPAPQIFTDAEIAQLREERALLIRRQERVERFIAADAATSPECAAIMRECRDALDEERLRLDLMLSVALMQQQAAQGRPALGLIR